MTAYATKGTALRRGGDESPTTYTLVPQVQSISGPTASAAEIDVTNLNSTSREFVTGITDYGQVTFTIFLDYSNSIHSGIKTDFDNGTTRSWEKELPDGTVEAFEAKVSGIDEEEATDDAVKATITLRLTGPVVLA